MISNISYNIILCLQLPSNQLFDTTADRQTSPASLLRPPAPALQLPYRTDVLDSQRSLQLIDRERTKLDEEMVNIGKYDESYLLERAEEIVIAKTTGSNVMDPEAEEAIPRFHPQGEFSDFFCRCCPTIQTYSTVFSISTSHISLNLFFLLERT